MERSLSVIIPALNEAKNIEAAVRGALAIMPQAGIEDFEIIVVSCPNRRGFDDGTGALVERLAETNPRIRSLHQSVFVPLGENYQRAVLAATKSHVMLIPGDNENDPSSFVAILGHTGDANMVLAYTVNPEVRPWHRRILSALYTFGLNTLFGHRLRYYNGINLYRTRDVQSVLPVGDSFAYSAEIVLALLRTGKTFVEIPVKVQSRVGRSNALQWENIKRVVVAILRLRLRSWSCKKESFFMSEYILDPSEKVLHDKLPPHVVARMIRHLDPPPDKDGEALLSIESVYLHPYNVVATYRTRRADGADGTRVIVFDRYTAVVRCLPVTKDGRVIMTDEYRPVRGKRILNLPGGGDEHGDAFAVAQSELVDEAGCVFESGVRLLDIGDVYSEDGVVDTEVHLIVADGLMVPPVHAKKDESIRGTVLIPWDEWQAKALRGEYEDHWCTVFAARTSLNASTHRVEVNGQFEEKIF